MKKNQNLTLFSLDCIFDFFYAVKENMFSTLFEQIYRKKFSNIFGLIDSLRKRSHLTEETHFFPL